MTNNYMIKLFLKADYPFTNSSVNASEKVGRHMVLQNAVAGSSPLITPSVSHNSSPSSHVSKLIFSGVSGVQL